MVDEKWIKEVENLLETKLLVGTGLEIKLGYEDNALQMLITNDGDVVADGYLPEGKLLDKITSVKSMKTAALVILNEASKLMLDTAEKAYKFAKDFREVTEQGTEYLLNKMHDKAVKH